MLVNSTKPISAHLQLKTGYSQQDTTTIEQLIIINPTCPCCGDTLLRHVRLGGLYWRCGSCNQEMPV